jgi:hypothetical protein
MITPIVAAALLAQAMSSPVSSPTPGLSLEWTKVALQDKSEYARYVRREPDGTQSDFIASRQVCDCDPANAVLMIGNVFAQVPGAIATRSTIAACGQQAQRIVVTGHANPSSPKANNIEVIAFRKEPAIYTLTYAFKGAAPLAEDEAALLTLCPAS